MPTETPLPALYAGWIESVLGTTVPDEKKATCRDCAMCSPAAERAGLPVEMHFRPDAKCCTVEPHLSNFLVGAILLDESPEAGEGRARVRRQIAERLGATPLGISPRPAFLGAYERMREAGTFGREKSTLCPYFTPDDGGLCTIWRHRDAVCSTYFCNHVRGAAGARFWGETRDLLRVVERELSMWCLARLDLAPSAMAELTTADGEPRDLTKGEIRGWIDGADGRLAPETALRVWGDWFGREEDFYRACAQAVRDLGWDDLRSIAPARVEVSAGRVRAAFRAAWADPVAPVLCRTNVLMTPLEDGVRVQTLDQPYAPLDLSPEVAEALSAFDGRPTAAVIEEVRERFDPSFDADVVRTLAERGVLVPPDGLDVPPALRPQHPLVPEDRLAFFRGFAGWAVTTVTLRNVEGSEVLVVKCGVKEVEFEEPGMREFGRRLAEHSNGFRAGDALSWGLGGGAMSWGEVEDLLTCLLEEEVLQRLPEG